MNPSGVLFHPKAKHHFRTFILHWSTEEKNQASKYAREKDENLLGQKKRERRRGEEKDGNLGRYPIRNLSAHKLFSANSSTKRFYSIRSLQC